MAAALTPRNRCTDVFDEVLAAFVRQDWDEIAERYAENFFVESRRAVLRHDAHGKEGSLEGWVAAAEVGARRAEVAHLATRGDRLALSVVRFGDEDTSAEAFTTDVLFLNELDADDRIVYAALLDADDQAAGFTALDERFVSGEGAPYADVIRVAATISGSYNTRDWTRFASVVASDFALIDHVPAAVGPLSGREAYVAYVRTMTELAPDVRMTIVRDHALSKGGGVSEARLNGTSAEGAEIEIAWLDVAVVRDGLLRRLEQYPTDQLAAALARFDELSAA